jgi:hypothetical protein
MLTALAAGRRVVFSSFEGRAPIAAYIPPQRENVAWRKCFTGRKRLR